jgi:hypothetical protein
LVWPETISQVEAHKAIAINALNNKTEGANTPSIRIVQPWQEILNATLKKLDS